MGKSSVVVIVAEKPSVAADLASVLGAASKQDCWYEGSEYVVSWSVGHLLEFASPEVYDKRYKRWLLKDLPILPEAFQLEPVAGQGKRQGRNLRNQLDALVELLNRPDATMVINACDAGREGELIFQRLYRFSGSTTPVTRLWLQSLQPQAIRKAFDNLLPAEEVHGLAMAAECRAEADWLIGINGTRGLTRRLGSPREKTSWSAGRVQTPTLALVVRRELEILAHEPQPYWMLKADFEAQDGSRYTGTYFDSERPKKGNDRIFDEAKKDELVRALAVPGLRALATEQEKSHRESAPPLFDLTSLQRIANRRFGFSATRTLSIAQGLYERHKAITYPRTDSRALPSDYRNHVQGLLDGLANTEAYGAHARRLLTQGLKQEKRNFNDAGISDHFAIVPTGKLSTAGFDAAEQRVFDLIVRRLLAAFHPPAEVSVLERITDVDGTLFKSRGRHLTVAGWKAVLGKEEEGASLAPLPRPANGDAAVRVSLVDSVVEEKETKPKARLTEATLLGLMETAGKEIEDEALADALKLAGGLGTPATRAETIEKLTQREYLQRCRGLNDRPSLRATPRAIRLIEFLERLGLSELSSPELTAELEESLSSVEAGKIERPQYMDKVRQWTGRIIESLQGFDFAELFADEQAIGVSPRGKGPVMESLRNYSAQSEDDDFTIWKERGGRYIDRRSAIQLLTEGRTPPKAGFFSRDGQEYEGYMVLNEYLEVDILRRGVEHDDEKSGPIAPCPFDTDRSVVRRSGYYRCDGCSCGKKLKLPTQLCQRTFTDEELVQLVTGARKTAQLDGFISRRKKPFSAFLSLDDNCKIQWSFPEREESDGDRTVFEINPEPLGGCGCGGEGASVTEQGTRFSCSSCNAALDREICKREVRREEALPYFQQGETAVLEGFISKRGKPFSALLYKKKTGRHGFRFPNAKGKGKGKGKGRGKGRGKRRAKQAR